MNRFLLSIWFLAISLNAFSYNALEEVRTKFPHFNSETEVDTYLQLLANDSSDLSTIYKGALYLFKSKFSILPTTKFKHFKKGKSLIDQACANSNSLEIRAIRLIFQYQLPRFLGYFNNRESDFDYLVKHFHTSNLMPSRKEKLLQMLLQLETLEFQKRLILKQLS